MLKNASGHSNPDEESALFKAMAHPVRLMILRELLKNPRCVTAIHEILDVRQPNISQHLSVLKNAGLVASGREGSYMCYYLRKPGLVKTLFEAVEAEWPEEKMENVRNRFRKALEERLEAEPIR